MAYKMLEYRTNATTTAEEHSTSTATDEQLLRYTSLAEQCGIFDEMDIGDNTTHNQTVEQEYQAYITAHSPRRT